MKEHTYKYNLGKIASKSILIWLSVAAQAALSIYVIAYNNDHLIRSLILANVPLSILTLPGIILHFNHLKHTRNVKLVLRYNTITCISEKEETTLNTFDINKVVLHNGPDNSRLPWWNYSWFELIDKEGKKIKVSYYLLDIGSFWMDSLSRRVNSDSLTQKKSVLPLIK